MFSKLFFKISIYFIIAVILITACSACISSISFFNLYTDKIEKSFGSVITSDFNKSLDNILKSDKTIEEKSVLIDNSLNLYKGKLSLSENRKFYVLNEDLSVIYPKEISSTRISSTPNLLAVISGASYSKNSIFEDYVDFAYYFTSNNKDYIIYLNDNKTDFRAQFINNIRSHLISLTPSIIICLLLSLLISKKIRNPIKDITKRAEGLEKGELFESIQKINIKEFCELRDAVNHMGFFMAESIRNMNSDKNKVEVILEHINNGIITFDINQNPIQINSAAKRILKLNDDKIKFDEFFKGLDVDICMAEFLYLDKSKTIEKEIKKDEGYIKTWFIPFKMDSERNAGVVCVFEDITEQFNVMSAMRKFVADVSHELKTPITVISSYTETVLNSYLDDKNMTANLLNIVYEESGKMTELIQNLLDISKYEMKAIPAKKEPFSIDDMISSLVQTFELEAQKKELSLNYNRMTKIPMFLGSRNDIERAVKNIISNSIKYTSRGDKINIFAGKIHNEIYIKIEDTGWGIPESKLGHLFERFYRVEDEARSRDRGGTGLGLSIAKEIIESYNGKIKIESEYTKYTRVTITLPSENEV